VVTNVATFGTLATAAFSKDTISATGSVVPASSKGFDYSTATFKVRTGAAERLGNFLRIEIPRSSDEDVATS
jgi:hypothetical protein